AFLPTKIPTVSIEVGHHSFNAGTYPRSFRLGFKAYDDRVGFHRFQCGYLPAFLPTDGFGVAVALKEGFNAGTYPRSFRRNPHPRCWRKAAVSMRVLTRVPSDNHSRRAQHAYKLPFQCGYLPAFLPTFQHICR